MISALDRQLAVELIDEARAAGARLTPACDVFCFIMSSISRQRINALKDAKFGVNNEWGK